MTAATVMATSPTRTNREKLFSVTLADCDEEKFRAGGKGGQGQNKRSVGVRIRHRASGAVGEARDSRSYPQNRTNAFLRMANSDRFKAWHKMECARLLGREEEVRLRVEKDMAPKNIRVERRNDAGLWEEWTD